MRQKTEMIKRDQYAFTVFVRQLSLMVKAWKKNEWGPRTLRIESGSIPGLDDHTEEHEEEGSPKKTYCWQIKKQSTPIDEQHIKLIFEGLNKDTSIIGVLAIRDLVSVNDSEGKSVGDLRTLRNLCDRARQPSVNPIFFISSSTKDEHQWIKSILKYLKTEDKNLLISTLSRLEIENTNGEEDIKRMGINYLSEIYENAENVWNGLHALVCEHPDGIIDYNFSMLYENVLKKHQEKNQVLILPTRFSISIDRQNHLLVATNHTTDHLVDICWGSPLVNTPIPRSTVHLTFQHRYWENEIISRALLRLGHHGGIAKFRTIQPEEWRNQGSPLIGNCFGMNPPAHSLWSAANDVLCTPPTAPTPNAMLHANSVDLDQYTKELTSHMNDWAWKHLNHLLEEELRYGNSQLGYEIELRFREQMTTRWDDWKRELELDIKLRDHFLYSNLTTAQESENRPLAKEIRLGPLTIKKCLMEATVFALAIVVALEIEGKPGIYNPGEGNIHFGVETDSIKCHLLGLEWIERKLICYSLNNFIPKEPHIPLLTHCSIDVIEQADIIVGSNTSFRTLSSTGSSFRTPRQLPSTPIPCDQNFRNEMSKGKTALARHLEQCFERSFNKQIDDTKKSIQDGSGRGNV